MVGGYHQRGVRRIIITSQDLLDPEQTKEKVYEYDINEENCFERSFQDFGISPDQIKEYAVLLGTLPGAIDYELRVITLHNDSRAITYKEILL